jgi:ABC-type multidrug transport system fused ATPase/permease subunit
MMNSTAQQQGSAQQGSAQQGSPPSGPAERLSLTKLARWSVKIIAFAPGQFVGSVAITTAGLLLAQAAAQYIVQITHALSTPNAEINSGIVWLAAFFLLLTLLRTAADIGGKVVGVICDSRMLQNLQQSLHDKILAQGIDYHDRHNVSETGEIVMMDAIGAQIAAREFIGAPVTQGITLITAMTLLYHNLSQLGGSPWWFRALLVASALLLPIFGARFARRLGATSFAAREAQAKLSNEYLNSASTPIEIQLLGARPQRAAAFQRSLSAYIAARMEQTIQVNLTSGFQAAVPVLLPGAMLAIGVWVAWATGSLDAGAILGVYFFVPMVVAPVSQIITFRSRLQMDYVMAAKVGALLDLPALPPATVQPSGKLPTPAVTLDHVSFTYPGAATPVLRDLSHVFAPGSISAIIGRSGTGKTSVFSLIEGLRAPDNGTVQLGGRRVGDIGQASLGAILAVISQAPVFIDDTVRANFQLAKADVADSEIEASCRAVGLWEKFERASPGAPLNCQLSRVPGTGVLSGGERRLLGVARVLLRQPAVLLLDEPTTGVDPISIETLARIIKETAVDKTVILVEHNLDFVTKIADQVCCLVDGAFADTGTPAELAARPSLFRTMLETRDAHVGADIVIERYPLTTLDAMPKGAAAALPGAPSGRPKAPVAAMAKGMS